MALFRLKSIDSLAVKVSAVLSIPTQLAANTVISTTNTVNTALDIVSPIGLAGNALLGQPFQEIHRLGDQVIDGVSGVANNVAIALGATIQPNDTHHKNEWEDQDLTLNNILNTPKDLLANTLVGTTNIVNDVLNAAAPIGLAGNALIPGFDVVHQAGDKVIHAVSETVYDIGDTLGATVQANETHNTLEWSQPSASATEELKSALNNGIDQINQTLASLPNLSVSIDIAGLPEASKLLGNGLVTTSNVVNTVLDVVSPLGLAGNALFGQPFETVHELGDRVIDAASNALTGAGQALGATVEAQDTHYQNEWEDGDLQLESLLNLPTDLIDNLLTTTNGVSNQVGEAFTALIDTLDDRLKLPFSAENTANQGATNSQDTRPTLFNIDNQYSYRVSESAFAQVQDLYQQFSATGSLQGKNFWRPIYTVIKNDLASNDAVDQGTKNWLKVAEAVATADPQSLLYQYVRLGTGKALADKGIVINDAQFWQASNVLVKTLATNFLNGVENALGEVVVPAGYLPSADGKFGLVLMDATQALENLGGELGDWTGITPVSILDHYLGVDTSELNGGDSRPFTWYLELLGDVIKANLKAGASIVDVVSQLVSEGTNFLGQFIQGEVFDDGFSSRDQLVNTLTQLAYAYAGGDLAGEVAVASNLFNAKTNIINSYSIFGRELKGQDGNDIIKAGIGNDTLLGGKGDDLLFGGWGNDSLNGGAGINVLVGGRGDDTYYVQSKYDFILEHQFEGVDHVISSADQYQLAQNVENLTLNNPIQNLVIAGSDIQQRGTGNQLDNIITGSKFVNNELKGLAGDDTLIANGGLFNLLDGGIGNDKLYGDFGHEVYYFDGHFGLDTIFEQGGNDAIQFGSSISIDDLLIADTGYDRIIRLKDSNDQITIKDWAKGTNYQVESIFFQDGSSINLQLFDVQLNYV